MSAPNAVVNMRQVVTRFGDHVVHNGVDLSVQRAEIFAVIGGSGSGKSTLLREMILLQKPNAGSITVLDTSLNNISPPNALKLRKRWGVMFQHGGLFGALTVLQNVGLPLREHTDLDDAHVDEIARNKLALAGLQPEVQDQYPSEISGGMLKRASLARALALEPELLFLDEPTAGLDPQSAAGVDVLVRMLRDEHGLSIVMITHDLDSLWQVANRVAVLAEGRVQSVGTMPELSRSSNPLVRPFFEGARARGAEIQAQTVKSQQEPSWKPK